MKIVERMEGGVPILELEGRLTIGHGDRELRDAVQKHLAGGRRSIVADMSGVKTLDSAGIGELVAQHVSARNRGGTLALAALSEGAGGVLNATQLTGVLQVYDSVKEALAALR